jgi:hypothetical protein
VRPRPRLRTHDRNASTCSAFGPHRYKAYGKWYLGASPSKESVQRLKTKIGNLLVPSNNDPWPELRSTRRAE